MEAASQTATLPIRLVQSQKLQHLDRCAKYQHTAARKSRARRSWGGVGGGGGGPRPADSSRPELICVFGTWNTIRIGRIILDFSSALTPFPRDCRVELG